MITIWLEEQIDLLLQTPPPSPPISWGTGRLTCSHDSCSIMIMTFVPSRFNIVCRVSVSLFINTNRPIIGLCNPKMSESEDLENIVSFDAGMSIEKQ